MAATKVCLIEWSSYATTARTALRRWSRSYVLPCTYGKPFIPVLANARMFVHSLLLGMHDSTGTRSSPKHRRRRLSLLHAQRTLLLLLLHKTFRYTPDDRGAAKRPLPNRVARLLQATRVSRSRWGDGRSVPMAQSIPMAKTPRSLAS